MSQEIKNELIKMLNRALELEYAAIVQYYAHAELVQGPCSEPIIARLKEIAGDEEKHAEKFRNLIAVYLGGEPIMSLATTHKAKGLKEIFSVNLKGEKEAVDFYKEIYRKVIDNKEKLTYNFVTLEHEIRHIILDEEEHIAEISALMAE